MTNVINEKLAQPITIKTSRLQPILGIFLALFFVPIGLWNFYSILTKGFALVPAVIGILILGGFVITLFLFYKGWQLMPRMFHSGGITRKDGKTFLWSELKNVEHQFYVRRHSTTKGIWRIEIRFEDGAVWIVPMKIVNFSDIYPVILALPCEHIEKTHHATAYQ